ncbi:MAG TPA: hypothetical protein PLV58_10095, partial [Campylobacterales bacterium]|nr:hypothetical protein [Campylobacterales bacterium]
MRVAYQLKSAELDSDFLESIKSLFKNKDIEIVISDDEEDDRRFGDILNYTFYNSQKVSEDS